MNAMTVLKNVVFKPAGFVGFQTVVDTGGPDRPAWRDGLGESGPRQQQHVCICRVAVTSGS